MASLEEITTLTFTPDNPCNTTITSSSGKVIYRVTTDASVKDPVTQVYDASDEVIASLEWRNVHSDRVILWGHDPVAFSDWVKKNHMPFMDEVSFKDDQGRKYKWKGTGGTGRYLELHSADDNFKTVIARYTKSYRKPAPSDSGDGGTGVIRTPGELRLIPRAKEVQDLVVETLLFQEKQRRLQQGGLGEGAMVGLMVGDAFGGIV
ncbi:uncharacterized protein PHACADRAFT_252089 [Phanerochaete carnosa HHB-10118-sp]|uniref:DUF6593 domain-containing protein n=1 Tax=Phanerochaete carnosa (strain HHB-10118-sp) TaxID=650164 RepID=K5V5W6_PHACS|nr:uncharacterized protein PHACADRAFT_252089 [Phanerochaete carnosa HHB-10118-sp]EKM58086.1 hypothetical protein PHACADRAFT_252089 [Phanerochaete carnosa HHB-10118-sp]